MIPIAHSTDKIFGNEDEFKKYISDICVNHKESNRAMAFAFIVYNFKNPSISKVLKDHDYWEALNSISGKYLSVFYFDKPKKKCAQKMSTSRTDVIYCMTSVGKMLSPETVNDYIYKTFNLSENVASPFVVFFQTEGENITKCFVVKLKKEKVEESFLELKQHIKNAVESIEEVTPENSQNSQCIYSLIENGVKNGTVNEFIKTRIFEPLTVVTTIGSFFKLFT